MGIVTVLGACSSTKEVKQIIPATPNIAKQSTPFDQDSGFFSGQNPAMTIIKSGKTLNLVRIMDGAACKNEFEGAKGSFLLYADPTDIERIKREQGVKVFTEFENKIQTFSEIALQQAINATNLDDDPFALGKDEAREKLARRLSANFKQSATPAIANFEKETTLTVEVAAFSPSFEFYQQGCQAALNESLSAPVNQTQH